MQNKLYFDYASTTPLDTEVYESYTKLLKNHFVNSESLYDDGVYIKNILNQARQSLATSLCVDPQEVIFTSGASEANNLAIKGLCFSHPEQKEIITSTIEHSSVLDTYKQLERLWGYKVNYIGVDEKGCYDLEQLKRAINKNTLLVSLMWVNNEVGTIQDVAAIKAILKMYPRAYLHIDAVQALGKIDLDLNGIDLLTLSAHKIHGLKGSGLLIKKARVKLEPLIVAGQQEFGLRGGTSNALVHIMFAKTLRLALARQKEYSMQLTNLKAYLIASLEKLEGIVLNSPKDKTTYIVNVSTPLKSEILLNALNQKGIMVSALSTCHSQKTSSHVLEAMGLKVDRIRSSIRISLDYLTTKDEIDMLVNHIEEAIKCYGIS